MRKSLKELIEKTIIFEYKLPNSLKFIDKTIYSTENDQCYSSSDNEQLADIIYNSIIEYAFNEYELENADYQNAHSEALLTRIKFSPNKGAAVQLKHGFFGEVLLYCVLCTMHKAMPLISRGYFYNPLENSETKGFDSYHIIEDEDKLELWCGEVKFHAKHSGGIDDALNKIDNALSDDYLNKNLLALPNNVDNFNKKSKIDTIITQWKQNPNITILEEAKKHNQKLVYPILLLFNEGSSGYDESIKSVIKHIKDNHSTKTFSLSVELSIFFILIPVNNTKEIKTKVLEWIKANKLPMS